MGMFMGCLYMIYLVSGVSFYQLSYLWGTAKYSHRAKLAARLGVGFGHGQYEFPELFVRDHPLLSTRLLRWGIGVV